MAKIYRKARTTFEPFFEFKSRDRYSYSKYPGTTLDMEQDPASDSVIRYVQDVEIKPVVVGIYGISGCGKTHLMNELKISLSTEGQNWYVSPSIQACLAFHIKFSVD